jgi:hypothetical protein
MMRTNARADAILFTNMDFLPVLAIQRPIRASGIVVTIWFILT